MGKSGGGPPDVGTAWGVAGPGGVSDVTAAVIISWVCEKLGKSGRSGGSALIWAQFRGVLAPGGSSLVLFWALW